MKTILIAALIMLAMILVVSQIWANGQVKEIEEYTYRVERVVKGVEIRVYDEANFIQVTMPGESYERNASNGFRILAGYIFGGNSEQLSIAMTSPVEMEMRDSVTMKFMVPAKYALGEMPLPNDASIQFIEEKKRRMAAITFGGFANDERIAGYRELLYEVLRENELSHSGNWSFMGYDPPFKLTGRRNEVVVELD